MLPRIGRLLRLDVYRDGGSLSASFEGEDGVQYTLLFKVNTRADMLVSQTKSYKYAALEKYVRSDYKSPVTGIVSPDWKHESHEISWEDARAVLQALAPQVKQFASEYHHVFPLMLEVAKRDGKQERS